MDKKALRALLYSFTESEEDYQKYPEKSNKFFRQFDAIIPTFDLMAVDHQNKFFKDEKRYLFKTSTIEFIQHTRFTQPPLHKHNHIEMAYVYRGSCKQMIHGEVTELTEGDFCILDSNTVHTLYDAQADDIIVNIVLQKQFFNDSFLNRLSDHSVLSQFIVQALSEKNETENFLIFRATQPEHLHELFEQMLIEYYTNDTYTTEVLKSYLFIFLTTIIRQLDTVTTNDLSERTAVLPMLKYIEDHATHCTLQQIADIYSYHPNYISKLLKEHTGKSYQELVLSQKMKKAKYLLIHTEETVQEISEQIGYQNLSFFYKKFYQETQQTPKQFRTHHRAKSNQFSSTDNQ